MDDTSASIQIGLGFENPTPLSLAIIQGIDTYFQIENTNVVKVSIQNLALLPGLNEKFLVKLVFTMVDAQINPDAVRSAIEKAATTDFSFGIVGPVNITNAAFITDVTGKMAVTGKYSDLASLLAFNSSQVQSVVSNITSMLGDSKIGLVISSKNIQASLGLSLPIFKTIIPPKSASFPYTTTLGIYGANNAKAIQVDVSPISLARISDGGSGFSVNVNATITPENNDNAAVGLAQSVNPILAADPKVSISFSESVF